MSQIPGAKLRISQLKVMRFSTKQRKFVSLQASLTASHRAELPREKEKKPCRSVVRVCIREKIDPVLQQRLPDGQANGRHNFLV